MTIHNGTVRLRATSYGTGHPVLLLHAGMERRTVWQPVAEGLAGSGYRAVAMDQRGHGDSDRVAHYRLADFVSDVVEATTRISESQRVVLAGASLGGFAALMAAAHNQARVAGLVLIDVVAAPDPERTRGYLTQVMATTSPADQAMCGQIIPDILGQPATLRRAARRLRIPTLLVRGGRSPGISAREVAQFRTDVPHGRIRTVPHAGHLVARDQPDRLLRVLRSFLADPAVAFRLAGPMPGNADGQRASGA